MSLIALVLIAQATAPSATVPDVAAPPAAESEIPVPAPIGGVVAGPVVQVEAFELGRRGELAAQPGDEFDPSAGLFDGQGLCVVVPGEDKPDCARGLQQEITLNEDVFTASIGNAVSTCQTIETIQRGRDGQPQRVFATVCGDDVNAWNFRTRETPSSESNPSRATERSVGPNEVLGPLRSPTTNE